jgi:outer membrane lipoprotein-sorting protein
MAARHGAAGSAARPDLSRRMRMRKGFFASLIVLLVISANSLVAAEWPTVLRDAETRCRQQHAQIVDMTLVQAIASATPNGMMNSRQTLYQRGELSRMEMTMPGMGGDSVEMKMIVVSDGKEAWMFSPFTGKRKLPESETRQHNIDTDCWDFTEANSRIVSSEMAQGKDCYVISLNKDSVQHMLWMDKSSLTVLQGVSFSGADSVRWVLSDFRPVIGDYQHPHKVEMFDGDQLINSMTVESIQVNSGLSDDLFNPDKVEYKQMDMDQMLQQMMQSMPDTLGGDSMAPESR